MQRSAAPDPADRGSATVWAAGAVAVVLVLAVAGMQLGGVLLGGVLLGGVLLGGVLLGGVLLGGVLLGGVLPSRHRAESAADLAALAAAGRSVAGQQVACVRARGLAERMTGELVSCRLEGWDALVEVQIRPGGPLARFGSATARARAGPVHR